MNKENEIIYTFCWFDEEQWELLSKLDPKGTDDSYSQWRNNANNAISDLKDNGQNVKKISIKTLELEKWCKERNLEPNGKSRSEYASFLAQARNEKT